MKNNIAIFSEMLKAVSVMYKTNSEYKACFDKCFEEYLNSLPEKQKTKLKVMFLNFKG